MYRIVGWRWGKKLREGSQQKPRAGRSHNVKRVFEAETIGFLPTIAAQKQEKWHILLGEGTNSHGIRLPYVLNNLATLGEGGRWCSLNFPFSCLCSLSGLKSTGNCNPIKRPV